MNISIQQLHLHFQTFLRDLPECALMDNSGAVLFVQSKSGLGGGHLPLSLKTATRYFQMQVGDAIILNDPMCGGSHLHSLVWVCRLTQDFFLSLQTPLVPRLNLDTENQSESGLRIPPTPFVQGWKINSMISGALCGYPSAPKNLSLLLEGLLEGSLKLHSVFKCLRWSAPLREAYLKHQRGMLKQLLKDEPVREMQTELRISAQEALRLKIKLQPQGVIFDFTGSQVQSNLAVPESILLGVCLESLQKELFPNPTDAPLCQSLLECVQTLLPSTLQTQSLGGVWSGACFLVPLIQKFVHLSLQQILHPKSITPQALANMSWGYLLLGFREGILEISDVSCQLHPQMKNENSVPWNSSRIEKTHWEKIEMSLPVLLKDQLQEIQLLKAGVLQWHQWKRPLLVVQATSEDLLMERSGEMALSIEARIVIPKEA